MPRWPVPGRPEQLPLSGRPRRAPRTRSSVPRLPLQARTAGRDGRGLPESPPTPSERVRRRCPSRMSVSVGQGSPCRPAAPVAGNWSSQVNPALHPLLAGTLTPTLSRGERGQDAPQALLPLGEGGRRPDEGAAFRAVLLGTLTPTLCRGRRTRRTPRRHFASSGRCPDGSRAGCSPSSRTRSVKRRVRAWRRQGSPATAAVPGRRGGSTPRPRRGSVAGTRGPAPATPSRVPWVAGCPTIPCC